jgi:hypothetical protein
LPLLVGRRLVLAFWTLVLFLGLTAWAKTAGHGEPAALEVELLAE